MCALEAAAAKKAQENRIKSGIAEVERIAKSLRITDGIVFKITITGMPHFFPAVADLPQLADIVVMNVKQLRVLADQLNLHYGSEKKKNDKQSRWLRSLASYVWHDSA